MKKIFFNLLLISSFSLFAQIPAGYYDNAQGLTGDQLKTALHNIIENHTTFSYSAVWDQLKYTDEDPNNSNNVLLLYTGWSYPKNNNGGGSTEWNREHVWAKSHGNFGTASGPGTDLHHLRPTDVTVNSARGNLHFDNGGADFYDNSRYQQSGSFNTGCKRVAGETWEPRDEVKGDVARMIFYMATCYEGQGSYPDLEVVDYIPATTSAPLHAKLSTLLQWNAQDPVSDWEIRRNNRIYERQHNRNPFIDHPEYVDLIWNPTPDTQAPTVPTNLIATNISNNAVSLQWQASTDDTGVVGYEVYKDGQLEGNTNTTTYTVTGLQAQTTYDFCVKAKDAAGNLSACSTLLNVTTTAQATYVFYEDFNDCATVKFTAYNEASDKNWECLTTHGEGDTGAMQMNGYNEDVPSKDWLITTNPVDFDNATNEELSLYTVYTYGNMPIVLVYSSDYDGTSNPSTFTWTPVPNVVFDTPTGSSTEQAQVISNVDISSITGTVYLAFKYYSTGSPTRWTIDNFIISGTTASLQQLQASDVQIYPNPVHVNSDLYIKINSNINVKTCRIYNISGQELLVSTDIKNGIIKTSHLKKGLYFVKINADKGNFTRKIIVE